MYSSSISAFSSQRVGDLAVHALKNIFARFELVPPSDDICNLMVSCTSLDRVARKIPRYLSLRHRGKYGPIDNKLQQQLNFELLILEILGKPARKKRKLIKQVVKQNDTFLRKSMRLSFNEKIISDLITNYEFADSGFQRFLRRVDNLLTIQKAKLRSHISSDEDYQKYTDDLIRLYQKHLKRAVGLNNEMSMRSQTSRLLFS
jgi:hypothetical protein